MEPMEPTVMRRINTASTLCALFDAGSLSMNGLLKRTGLSRKTVDAIMEPLLREGWVRMAVPHPERLRAAGRPARRYDFNYDAGVVIAVQLDLELIEVLVTNLRGEPLSRQQQGTTMKTSRQGRLEAVLELAARALAEIHRTNASVFALTVSTPGIVRDDGSVDLPLAIPDWSGFSIAAELQSNFACVVSVENDAKLAALGELHARAGREQNFLYMRIDGYRIGLGIVIDGQLYRGKDGMAGEIVWAPALGASAAQMHPLAALASPDQAEREAAEAIGERARAGDPTAIASIQRLASDLAPGITALAWTIAPEVIVIGGAINHVSDLLIPALAKMIGAADGPGDFLLVASELGDEAMIDGALRRSLTQFRDILALGENLPAVIAPADPIAAAG